MMLNHWVSTSWQSKGTLCLQSQGSSGPWRRTTRPLRMKIIRSLKMVGTTHPATQHHMTEQNPQFPLLLNINNQYFSLKKHSHSHKHYY